MQRKLWLSTLLSLCLLVAGAAMARPGHGDSEGHHGPKGDHSMGDHWAERIAERLDLSADQQTQWKALRDEHRAAAEPLVEQMHQQRSEIRDLLEAGEVQAAVVGQLMIDSHQIGEQLRTSRETLHAAFRNLLTSEQQQQLDEMRANHGERGEHHRRGPGHRGSGRRGPGSSGSTGL